MLENAALRFANGHALDARRQLEEGIENDIDTKLSVLAWLALFDLLQRQGDRAAFDKLALQYVVQFERSAPAWEVGDAPAASPRVVGGSIAVTGKVTASAATQIEGIRRAVAKQTHGARIDLMSVIDFDDTGARLLANALAEARRSGLGLQLLQARSSTPRSRTPSSRAARQARGRGSCRSSSCSGTTIARRSRIAPSNSRWPSSCRRPRSSRRWAPLRPLRQRRRSRRSLRRRMDWSRKCCKWTGVLTGSLAPPLGKLADSMHSHSVVAVDMSEVERIDFVCAGALLNVINRIETQRKTVQIVGASPIVRALLLLIGVSPRHFVKKPQ